MESRGLFREFAANLLGKSGALVDEIEPEGLAVLLPLDLQTRWRGAEMLHLGFGIELPPDAQRVSLESDWLERFGELMGEGGRSFRIELAAPDLAPPAPERLLENHLVLPNAVFRYAGLDRAWTRYLILLFRYTAMSDEKREGVIKLGINLHQGSSIEGMIDDLFLHALNAVETSPIHPVTKDLPADWPPARLDAFVRHTLPPRIEEHLANFLQGMQRRLDRDLERVFDYYDGLRREAVRQLRKRQGDSARERLRIEAAVREYQAKVADLKQKYDLRVTVQLSQAMEILMPVSRLRLVLKRRKKERQISLDWNSLVRRLDPLPCEWGCSREPACLICDDALHLVGQTGLSPCPQCGKEYCRACHPRQCPKCRVLT